jgi:phosphatidylglycerol lysyltransferase
MEAPLKHSVGFRWLDGRGALIRNILSVTAFAVAMWLLFHEFSSYKAEDVALSLRSLPWWVVAAALFFTACNYLVLIGYDWLGVRAMKYPLSFRQVSIAAMLYYAFSNALGVVLGGAPVRVRMYSAWGMPSQDIVRLLVLIAASFWVGLFLVGGILFVFAPFEVPARLNLPFTSSLPLGIVLLTIAASYFVACIFRQSPLHFLGINFQPPSIKIALAQTTIASCDFLLASAVLYVLLPSDVSVGFFSFTAIYLLAIIVALVSHVPGGVGIIELVLVTMLPQSSHGLVASLVAYRVIYYLVPLLLAVTGVAIATIRPHFSRARTVATETWRWTSIVGPRIITGAVFVAGLLLLISGALPAVDGRMQIVRRTLPLPMVELSHFLGSIIGALLLILARALQQRIDAAWGLTTVLLGVGAVVSLFKGLDYEEALILSVLALILLACRKHFYRRGALFSASLTTGWIAAVMISMGLMVWLVFFSYSHVEYSHELWWEFAFRGDAPRSMRSLIGATVVIALFGISRLFRSRPSLPSLAADEELCEIANVVKTAESTNANLALLGDKRFIFSKDRRSAVMFGCEGDCWISMGDPIGPESSADDAAWNFREACDAAGALPVFYQIDESSLGRYVEMGLSMIKLGEEARVPLKDFSLEGSSRRKDLRRTKKRFSEAGLSFEIVPQSNVPTLMPRLKEISDAWLGNKSAGEKGFSLGYFNEAYLSRYDIAIVKLADNPIAFANLWRGANQQELSIDLMRYVPDSPHGVMEYLFIELMLYGKTEGYHWFNLGMAPLSGVDSHRLGPVWNQISNLLFRHGEHFYNFQGLRNYKRKFDPEWFPKYLASPGGFALPKVLANVSTLISGGVIKLIKH